MRQLVTYRKVDRLEPIEGADLIELAHVDGWQCVVKKGEFQPNDFGLFFEIDSLLPSDDERFAFMAKTKFRVRTIKLRGQISQGLLLPFEATLTQDDKVRLAFGESFQDILGVTLYEPPVPIGGQQKGTFPTHLVPKTDQERIQNIPEMLRDRMFADYEITEKLDGTSCTIWYYHDDSVELPDAPVEMIKDALTGVASRNFEMKKDDDNVYSKILRETRLRDKLCQHGLNIAIQGEIIGPGIQGNKYKRPKQEFYVFDIYDIDTREYLSPALRQALTAELGLKHVPILNFLDEDGVTLDLRLVLDAADGKSQLADTAREGLVFKSKIEYEQASFKAISNKWLLKNE